MNETTLKEPLFPAKIAVKVIIPNDAKIIQEISSIVLTVFPNFDLNTIKTQLSANEAFCSLTYPVFADSKLQMDELYQKLKTQPQIKLVL